MSDNEESQNDTVTEMNKLPVEHVESMYREWYLDYASYVILDRAVPYAIDGLKPVQRRLLHSLWELDDGRFHKVANVIGHTMKFHPHGDAAIYEALVGLGQKDLLVDCQGNWGNTFTGDRAAAPRYIEARLSKFAKEVIFNPEITNWQTSYDGRAKEPLYFPVRFPLLLALGVEGIAVGLTTKILPHNFSELLKAGILHLKGKSFEIYPDFPSGGLIDVSEYDEGKKGGRVKVRARIDVLDRKTLKISEIPYGLTTQGLIDSILNANDKGKVKIKKIEDNTASEVEILVHLAGGSGTPQETIEALFAFTDAEISISPNCCIIADNRPHFIGVADLLRDSVKRTEEFLRLDLEKKLSVAQEKLHFSLVEKIFISKRVYRIIEDCDSWEAILAGIEKGLKPYEKLFVREVSPGDIEKLTEIRLKRISRFDSKKAEADIEKLDQEIKDLEKNLANMTAFTIAHYEKLLKDYGAGRERCTEIAEFTTISKAHIAKPNLKLYFNAKDGFIGTGLKKDTYLFDCSEHDEIAAFTEDGKFVVFQPQDKFFAGQKIIKVMPFVRGDERTVYHMIYRDGKSGDAYSKRFTIPSITRNKHYDLTRGTKDSKILYFNVLPHGEEEKVKIILHPSARAIHKEIAFDFAMLPIKNRDIVGDRILSQTVQKIVQVSVGETTLEAQKLWFDAKSNRAVADETDFFLGSFAPYDKLLAVYKSGLYEVVDAKPQSMFSEDLLRLEMITAPLTLSVLYFDGERGSFYLKRFEIDAEITPERTPFMALDSRTYVYAVTSFKDPDVQIRHGVPKGNKPGKEEIIHLLDHVKIRKKDALGTKVADAKMHSAAFLVEENPHIWCMKP